MKIDGPQKVRPSTERRQVQNGAQESPGQHVPRTHFLPQRVSPCWHFLRLFFFAPASLTVIAKRKREQAAARAGQQGAPRGIGCQRAGEGRRIAARPSLTSRDDPDADSAHDESIVRHVGTRHAVSSVPVVTRSRSGRVGGARMACRAPTIDGCDFTSQCSSALTKIVVNGLLPPWTTCWSSTIPPRRWWPWSRSGAGCWRSWPRPPPPPPSPRAWASPARSSTTTCTPSRTTSWCGRRERANGAA